MDRPMGAALSWSRDGQDWPNREASQFVQAGGVRWHVQKMGSGPLVLLVHGTGSATHSWRGLAPLLARRFQVLAPDLPGHGFTTSPPSSQLSLPGMSHALGELLKVMGLSPEIAVGHSAGAAILARMTLDRMIAPKALVSLNGALLPLRGIPGLIFPPAARLMAVSSLTSRVFAWCAGDGFAVQRLIDSTGSTIEAAGVRFYQRLISNRAHVAATLGMMARWDLSVLERDLPGLSTPVTLAVSANDQTVPPADSERVRALLPRAQIVSLGWLGHLAHEEQPRKVAALLTRLARTSVRRAVAPSLRTGLPQ